MSHQPSVKSKLSKLRFLYTGVMLVIALTLITESTTASFTDQVTLPDHQITAGKWSEVEVGCLEPDDLGDHQIVELKPSFRPEEISIQEFFESSGIALDTATDQANYQLWRSHSALEIKIESEFMARLADHSLVFGFYTDSDLDSFTPLFRQGYYPKYGHVEEASVGDSFELELIAENKLGFAISVYDRGREFDWQLATENSLNPDHQRQVVVYDLEPENYLLAFEDIPRGDPNWVSDDDFNDLIVKVTVVDCLAPEPITENSDQQALDIPLLDQPTDLETTENSTSTQVDNSTTDNSIENTPDSDEDNRENSEEIPGSETEELTNTPETTEDPTEQDQGIAADPEDQD